MSCASKSAMCRSRKRRFGCTPGGTPKERVGKGTEGRDDRTEFRQALTARPGVVTLRRCGHPIAPRKGHRAGHRRGHDQLPRRPCRPLAGSGLLGVTHYDGFGSGSEFSVHTGRRYSLRRSSRRGFGAGEGRDPGGCGRLAVAEIASVAL